MIRILQQDSIYTKVIFAVIIGATIILMVIFLVPGIFDNGDTNDASVYRHRAYAGRAGPDHR